MIYQEGRKNDLISRLTIAFSVVALIFSITNVVPISGIMICLVVLLPLILVKYQTHHVVFVSCGAMLLYFVVSSFLYHPASIVDYDFLRRDGNVFISFMPILVLSLLKLNISTEKILYLFVIFASIVNGVFILVYKATGGTFFFKEPGIYHFLFAAHNAAGGFLSILLAFNVGLFVVSRKKTLFLLSLVNLFGLYLTDSRGSLLAIGCSVFIVAIHNRKKLFTLALAAIIFSQLFLFYYAYQHKPSDFLYSNLFFVDGFDLSEYSSRGYTIVNRLFYLWPRAEYLFLQSPIFGTGFGSYNDVAYQLRGIPHIFMYNDSNVYLNNDAHAHHSFFHILAETGLVGLLLVLILFKKMYGAIINEEKKMLRISLHLAFWSIIISSLTEHRLFTPSQMLPFLIVLGLAIAESRYKSQEKLDK